MRLLVNRGKEVGWHLEFMKNANRGSLWLKGFMKRVARFDGAPVSLKI
jgi:hypothetical protein